MIRVLGLEGVLAEVPRIFLRGALVTSACAEVSSGTRPVRRRYAHFQSTPSQQSAQRKNPQGPSQGRDCEQRTCREGLHYVLGIHGFEAIESPMIP